MANVSSASPPSLPPLSERFPNLGILHVTKKKVPEVLTHRLTQLSQLNNNITSVGDMETDIELSDGKSYHSSIPLVYH